MPVHFSDRVHRPARGTIAVGTVLEVSLEDWFQHELGSGLDYPIPDRGNAERCLAAGFGIITRRTGSGRYVFEISSSRKPANHLSKPDASIAAKVIPAVPGAPAL